jgi:hypothetical protein
VIDLHVIPTRFSTTFALLVAAAVFTAAPSVFAEEQPPTTTAVEEHTQLKEPLSEHERAELELQKQKKQRILGIIPNFNTSNVQDAARLSSSQKFHLALRGAIDPFTFLSAGINAGFEQASNTFPDYGQGAAGYGKRMGAAYADNFSGAMFAGAIFPTLLHQDPRYFRKGTGKFSSRLFYAISTTVKAKNDEGKWGPNYSNILGNIAAGGLSNLYYPAADRGVKLTFQRALIVTAEGSLGAILVEFWPDIASHLHKH